MVHQAGAYPSFCCIKRLEILLLPPEWDASPLQGFPGIKLAGTLSGWREALRELSVLPINTTQCPRLGLVPVELTNHEATAPPTMYR